MKSFKSDEDSFPSPYILLKTVEESDCEDFSFSRKVNSLE